MSASQSGRADQHGRRALVAGALALGCLFVGLTACSGGSDETSSAATTSASSAVASSSSATSAAPTASGTATAPAPATATAGEPSPAADPAADAVVKISVRGRTVSPAPGRRTISVGDRVQLIVTTDTANKVHVHGVEIEEATKPGVPLTVNFEAKDPGIYAVELHDPELLLVQLVVR
jgi:plastocyanin